METCATCGADAAGNFCANCGAELVHDEPEPIDTEVIEEAIAAEADAQVLNAEANATYAAAELERASAPTEEEAAIVASDNTAEVAEAAIDALADVAEAAIELAADATEPAAVEEPELGEGPPDSELAELAAEELAQHEREHELLPPQPDDNNDTSEHVEPITLLAPARSAASTRRTRSAWQRHRRA